MFSLYSISSGDLEHEKLNKQSATSIYLEVADSSKEVLENGIDLYCGR